MALFGQKYITQQMKLAGTAEGLASWAFMNNNNNNTKMAP